MSAPAATVARRSEPPATEGPPVEQTVRAGDDTHHHRLGGQFLTLMGGRFTRHTLILIAGTLAVGPFSLISLMVLTRILNPSQYGELAVLFIFAGYLTMLYNTGSLHGTFMLVYGASEGEGDDIDSDTTLAHDPRRALGTGVVLTLMIVTAGTAVCLLLASPIAQLLLQRSHAATLVCWAAASAASGSLWRLTVNVLRMERQPVRFAVFNAIRPLFVVGGTIPLVALGFGVQGALAGTTVGTLIASAVCVAIARHSYAFAFSLADAREIVRRGSLVVVPVLSLFVVHSADVVLLSRYAPAHEVGLYRVASRFGAVPSYFASAFLMAWAPLERGVLFQATYRHVGEQRVRGAILTYYLLAGMTLVVLLDVFAGGLMLLAGPSYRASAPLIPLVGIGFVCYGLYVVLVRMARVHRMFYFAAGAVLAAVLDIGLSIVTIPWLGAYGVPLAMIVALLVACTAWLTVVKVVLKVSISFQARPLLGLAAAVAIAATVQFVGEAVWPAGHPVVLGLVLLSYLAGVVAFGVVPRRHLRPLLRLARAATRGGMGGADPARGLDQLGAARRNLLAALERDRIPPAALAERLGWPESRLRSEYVAALRELIGAPEPIEEAPVSDEEIARYLLSKLHLAQRDAAGRELVDEGMNALELMELDEAAARLRALAPRAWPARGLVTTATARPATRRASTPPAFAGLARDLRDAVIDHHEHCGEHLDTPGGIVTLDTNTVLAADRGRLLLRLLAEQGVGSIEGRRVLDLGAGFGALALYFAHLGAEVVAVDPNETRMRMALAIAQRRGLKLSILAAEAQSLPLADASFDIVVANNSLYYITDRGAHGAALREIHRVLRPGGWTVLRNPNRLSPRDRLAGLGLPGVGTLGLSPSAGSRVHLRTPAGTVRAMRRAGFAHARWQPRPGGNLLDWFAGHHHVVARRAGGQTA
jgi:O-antigen/teichoic acid export membrane protein/SAM-dependent methyltransferase